jgi:hypothetical protein
VAAIAKPNQWIEDDEDGAENWNVFEHWMCNSFTLHAYIQITEIGKETAK